jgi:hypothetical protein
MGCQHFKTWGCTHTSWVAERNCREAKAWELGEWSTGLSGGHQPALLEGRLHCPRRPPKPTRSGTEPANWTHSIQVVQWDLALCAQHPDHCPEPCLYLCLFLYRQMAQGPVVKSTTSMGKQAVASDWQLSCTQVGVPYAVVVARLDWPGLTGWRSEYWGGCLSTAPH